MRSKLQFILIAMSFFLHAALAQQVTAPQILENIKRQFESVQDYTVTLKVSVDMERMQIPEMIVTMFFKQPDKVHIESKNFAMIPREAVAFSPVQILQKFDATLVGTEEKDHVTYYRLRLVSKPEKGKPVRESYIIVDGSRWVVTHFESTPTEMRKILVDFEYTTIDTEYILPSKIDARLDAQPPADSTAERMYSPQRLPRKGSIAILYSDYKVNTGLADEIFEKKETKK